VASRFAQTLIKNVPVDTNPVKMAFSIAKAIIDMKDVGCCLSLERGLTIISGGRRQQRRACTTSQTNGKQAPGCGEDCSYRHSEGC
jgi:hypothetical protein